MRTTDILIIGGGAAGLAAALGAKERGASVLVIEREARPGGILNQCIHHGFGLGYFGEDLTGPEYAARMISLTERAGVECLTDTSVVSLNADRTAVISSPNGIEKIAFSRCILASGCRERSIGALNVGGTRPAGVFTAGAAQKLMNVGHYRIGNAAVILGSGDMGQIVGRRLILRSCRVIAMVEKEAECGGLARNRRECVEKYGIPVITRATVDELHGEGRLCGVTVRHLDSGQREFVACDTLITAVGLIPERELALPLMAGESAPEWLRLAGNCSHVHDFADAAGREGQRIGQELAEELKAERKGQRL